MQPDHLITALQESLHEVRRELLIRVLLQMEVLEDMRQLLPVVKRLLLTHQYTIPAAAPRMRDV